MDFNRRANFVPRYMLFLSILRRRAARRVDVSIRGANIFVFFFFDFSAVQAEFILDYWNKSDDFWDSLRSSQSSQLSESVSI